jgi:hypothetical protein
MLERSALTTKRRTESVAPAVFTTRQGGETLLTAGSAGAARDDFQDGRAGIEELSSRRPYRFAAQIEHSIRIVEGRIIIFVVGYGNLEPHFQERQGVKRRQQQAAEEREGPAVMGHPVPTAYRGCCPCHPCHSLPNERADCQAESPGECDNPNEIEGEVKRRDFGVRGRVRGWMSDFGGKCVAFGTTIL